MKWCFDCKKDIPEDSLSKCKELEHDIDYERLLVGRKQSTIQENSIKKKRQNVKRQIQKVKATIEGEHYESIYYNSQPYFLGIVNGEVVLKEYLETDTEIIQPPAKENLPYEPYSVSDADSYESIDFDNLLKETHEVIDNHIVMSEQDKIILLAYIANSYSLEWVSSLAYLAFIGDAGSGKTSALNVARHLMYRPLYGGDYSHANVFRFLGTDEEGTGSILEDEIQTMNKDKEKISGYKLGYTKGQKIPKINMMTKEQKQSYWNTFAPKIFAGEALPHDRALLERIVAIYMIQGTPKYDISRLSKSQIQAIQNIRKKWLVWKLQNNSKPNKTHDLNISGRNAQLFEDLLILFSGTSYYQPLKEAILHHIKEREDTIHEKPEAKVYRCVRRVMKKKVVSFPELWDHIINNLEGQKTNNPNEFELDDGFIISKKWLAKILKEKFNATPNRTATERLYVFDSKVVSSLDDKYKLDFIPTE